MELIGKPISQRQHLVLHGVKKVLYRDSIRRFIEKIAPKVSRIKLQVRRVKETMFYSIGGKKVKKFVFA